MKYKGYTGNIDKDFEDFPNGLWYGKVLNITDTVLYESDSILGMEDAFHKAVDDYLDAHGLEGRACKEK